MKISHNKKRNTLFLYEALVREYTIAKLEKNERKLQEIKSLLFEYFSDGKILKEELRIYKAILNTENVDKELAEKILEEAKRLYLGLGMDQIFQQQRQIFLADFFHVLTYMIHEDELTRGNQTMNPLINL